MKFPLNSDGNNPSSFCLHTTAATNPLLDG